MEKFFTYETTVEVNRSEYMKWYYLSNREKLLNRAKAKYWKDIGNKRREIKGLPLRQQ